LEKKILVAIQNLYKEWCGSQPEKIEPLPESGSYRRYFRISGKDHTVLAAHNQDEKENLAFIKFTDHFLSKGLHVPKIFAQDLGKHIYLLEDLGLMTLYDHLKTTRTGVEFSDDLLGIYKQVIDELIRFQIIGSVGFDYSYCYPRSAFDEQSMMWDLNYFKYYFLKLARIAFDEQALEDDFRRFTKFLLEANHDFFLYRDFQSRNVMLKDGKPFFIDYQGGRRGALQYDLASLLFDAKAEIPQEIRICLRDYYIEKLMQHHDFDKDAFIRHYNAYVFIRIMQAMGTYGFRGFYEKKVHFLQSIPFAVENLKYLLETVQMPTHVPELWKVLNALCLSDELKKYGPKEKKLTVSIFSFSYRKGIPADESGNGGGFVFDCRAVHNPGKYEQYMKLTGKDAPVIDFLDKEQEMIEFLKSAFSLVNISVNKYIERGFSNLMIAFGCTGGQHRSVYAAEKLAAHIVSTFNVNVHINHREQGINQQISR
jgi:aminoglycoside/choline kinase family phosphotransferase